MDLIQQQADQFCERMAISAEEDNPLLKDLETLSGQLTLSIRREERLNEKLARASTHEYQMGAANGRLQKNARSWRNVAHVMGCLWLLTLCVLCFSWGSN